ncbi:hypothetical protein ACIOHC_36320 [Streptomyces sp. NPDC088252]|uniref:hypothetical protein n=1 Tax=Streptomyces sp. NPDC088252 TaxID=3365845 RepID=UPI00380FD5CB
MSDELDRLMDRSNLGSPEVMQHFQDTHIIDGQTGRQFLEDLFESELCPECAGDVADHIAGPDQFGKWHAWCTFMAPRMTRFTVVPDGSQNANEPVRLRIAIEYIDSGKTVTETVDTLDRSGVPLHVQYFESAMDADMDTQVQEQAQELLRKYRLEQHSK